MPMMPLRLYILDQKLISGKEKKEKKMFSFFIVVFVHFVYTESVTLKLHIHLFVHLFVYLSI